MSALCQKRTSAGFTALANPHAMLVRAMPVVFPSALTLKPFSVEAEQKTPLR